MLYSKIFSGDLPELIYEIIKYFHNDFSTLHSCILVNRLWCRLAIPLLWENPFSIPTKNYKFIEIYLDNLNDDDFKTKYKIHNDLPSNTLFNYPSFIKCLDTFNIVSSISKWVKTRNSDSCYHKYDTDYFKKLINRSLFKIFIENEVNLHTLDIDIDSYFDDDNFNDVFELILQNPSFIQSVKNLNLYLRFYDDSFSKNT